MVSLLGANCFFSLLLLSGFLLLPCPALDSSQHVLGRETSTHDYDVIIYGNTVAALAAAIQTTRMGKTAAVVTAKSTLGGLTTSGLGWTDSKNGSCIGGIAREFYAKVYTEYEESSRWKEESRETYVSKRIRSQPGPAIDTKQKVQWTFEPKVAEAIWEDWIKEEGIRVFRNASIQRSQGGVDKDGANITAMTMQDGSVFRGKMFIDASYEGDLMDVAQIPWRIGRESRDQYDEPAAGFIINEKLRPLKIDPFMNGDREEDNNLVDGIGRIMHDARAQDGDADPVRLQSYNYRLCLTKDKDNQVSFSEPKGYDEDKYEILLRYIEKSGYRGIFFTASPMPNLKTDTNAKGEVSTDYVGGNYDNISNYMEWSNDQRAASAKEHMAWTQGLLWTLANHTRVPSSIRKSISQWGYAKDEFVSNDNFPYELYIREGRRMTGVYTMMQSDIQDPQPIQNDSVIAIGSYTFDVHRIERVLVGNDTYTEGFVHQPNKAPFPIPYGAIIPEAKDAINFLNPVTLSSTHIAFAAIRMEPTYMILGQSAATAAVLAIEQGVKVQDVDRHKLTERLKADSQVVEGSGILMRPPGWIAYYIVAWMLYLFRGGVPF